MQMTKDGIIEALSMTNKGMPNASGRNKEEVIFEQFHQSHLFLIFTNYTVLALLAGLFCQYQ